MAYFANSTSSGARCGSKANGTFCFSYQTHDLFVANNVESSVVYRSERICDTIAGNSKLMIEKTETIVSGRS